MKKILRNGYFFPDADFTGCISVPHFNLTEKEGFKGVFLMLFLSCFTPIRSFA